MFKNIAFIGVSVLTFTYPIYAQSLDDTLAHIEHMQTMQRIRQQESIEYQKQKEEYRQRKEEAKKAKINADMAARRAKRDAEKAAEKARKERRDQENYDLDMEIKRAEAARRIAIEKARAKHADDYVQQELDARKAVIDVIQSKADAARNVSEGMKKGPSKQTFYENDD